MSTWKSILMLLLATTSIKCFAQSDIENVIVETYYVSDANDATDTSETGVSLTEGSTTYRIYLDLCDSCSLRSVYGDANHALRIQSTALFFNHLDRGRTYGHQINNTALDEGTVALDSWLSLSAASNQHYGILKSDDTNGSILGGALNDGGSLPVPEGLLRNAVSQMGIPLTEQDGLVPLNGGQALPPTFSVQGDDPVAVFLDETVASAFVSNNTSISCATPGTRGPTAQNRVLIAQLTTAGELSFELNVQIEHPDGSVSKYVANGDTLLPDETEVGLLTYPPQCGCTDPNFLEYDPAAGCDDGSCASAIIFGCLDPTACNYDPNANFNIDQLCCYGPLDCNGLEVGIICPEVGITTLDAEPLLITLAPNPTEGPMTLAVSTSSATHLRYSVQDATGRTVLLADLGTVSGTIRATVATDALAAGIYHLTLMTSEARLVRTLVKN